MTYYYFCIFVFLTLGYFIVTDQSVAKFFDFSLRLLRIQYEKNKWWLLNNPRNPIVRYLMWRRSMKLAKELQKEFENK
jgi:hypothetical protein